MKSDSTTAVIVATDGEETIVILKHDSIEATPADVDYVGVVGVNVLYALDVIFTILEFSLDNEKRTLFMLVAVHSHVSFVIIEAELLNCSDDLGSLRVFWLKMLIMK
jgi:hypothetical protein